MTGCGLEKPISNFNKTKNWVESVCIECKNAYKRERYQNNKQILNMTTMKWG